MFNPNHLNKQTPARTPGGLTSLYHFSVMTCERRIIRVLNSGERKLKQVFFGMPTIGLSRLARFGNISLDD
jgi:hypothetical protein